MLCSANWVALNTIVYREVRRFLRIWPQTLLPPAITMVLYFVIFGNLIGRQIGDMGGFTYMTGAWLLQIPPRTLPDDLTFEWITDQLSTLWQPFLLGSVVCGVVLGILAYFTTLLYWRWWVGRQWRRRKLKGSGTHAAAADQQADAQGVQHCGSHQHKGDRRPDTDIRHP